MGANQSATPTDIGFEINRADGAAPTTIINVMGDDKVLDGLAVGAPVGASPPATLAKLALKSITPTRRSCDTLRPWQM